MTTTHEPEHRRTRGAKAPEVLGPAAYRHGPCGLCGVTGPRTRTHVPPRAVGNRNAVKRHQIVSDDHHARHGRGLQGGLHVPGLCAECNGRAGTWDPGYIALHKAMSPAFFGESRLMLPDQVDVPDTPIAVGAAARSILAAAFALNPTLRTNVAPGLARDLLSPAAFTMPANLDLRLAWAIGRQARIAGSLLGQYVLGYRHLDRTIGNLTAAQAHYAPIAWQLLFSAGTELCDAQGWPRINHWTTFEPAMTVSLRDVCSALPVVHQPRLHPEHGEGWIELMADEACYWVICEDIAAAGRNDPCPCGSGRKHKLCCQQL